MMKTGTVLAVMLIAAGCSRSVPEFGSSSGPAPLTPSPTPQVSANRLPPPPPPPPPAATTNPSTPATGTDTQTAALDPNAGSAAGSTPTPPPASSGGAALSRNKVLGAYKVTTAGGNCQIILSLTKWSGGYRAASRGCPGAVSDISAWDVSGNNVVLKNSSGSQVASVASSGDARFDGQTNGGEAISLYR
ncbi:protease inhibitor Inh/omp19 family protein [Fulvimarina sp. 2208YS6-2-32]|nr:protease inhibitor Inh/omp19 family protein [Fulvimarina sp. 2208YS6-2-32]